MSTARTDWARHFMWERLGHAVKKTAIANGNCSTFSPVYEDYEKANKMLGCKTIPSWHLDQCVELTIIKQEPEMNTQTKEQEARDHLLRRLSSIAFDKKNKDLYEHFHINGYRPKNKKEAEKWLKEGFYHLEKGFKYDGEEESYEGWNWGAKPDRAGYDKARELLSKEKTATEDIIHIKSADEGLAALQAFEAKTFH